MDLIRQLEYPLPILKILAEKIVIETSSGEKGTLLVDNIGGGMLSGRVMSNCPALKFAQTEFTGNQISLDYACDTDGCKPGDSIHSEVVVMSNGGEKAIPLIIKVITASIITAEDIKLVALKDFLAYAKKYPAQARRLFTSPEFMMWLTNIGYEYMDIFEYLIKDSNKERALENFFILSKLKNRAMLSIDRKICYLDVRPGQKDIITGEIKVNKTGWGYVEADVSVTTDGEDWISVSPERLTAAMFHEEDTSVSQKTTNMPEGRILPEGKIRSDREADGIVFGKQIAAVKYTVNAAKLKDKMNKATVTVGGIQVVIVAKKKSHISITTDKSCYDSEDSGTLYVTNSCGEDIMIEIATREGFVKFDGKRYYMGAAAEIPFTVKLNTLQLAQIGLKRQPFFENEIYITAQVGTRVIKRTVRVAATTRKQL